MRSTLRQQLSHFEHLLQSELFGLVEAETGQLSDTAKRLIATLEMIPLERFIPPARKIQWLSRPGMKWPAR